MYKQVIIAFIILAAISLLVYYRQLATQQRQYLFSGKYLRQICFIVYVCAVASVTIVPVTAHKNPNIEGHFNFVPFLTSYDRYQASVKENDVWGIENSWENFFGNILLFIPAGFFIAWLYNKKFWGIVIMGAVMSVLIESIQAINILAGYYRYVDIDDVILNTFGAIIGYWLFKLFFHARKKSGV